MLIQAKIKIELSVDPKTAILLKTCFVKANEPSNEYWSETSIIRASFLIPSIYLRGRGSVSSTNWYHALMNTILL